MDAPFVVIVIFFFVLILYHGWRYFNSRIIFPDEDELNWNQTKDKRAATKKW